jgi:hypothetical protein
MTPEGKPDKVVWTQPVHVVWTPANTDMSMRARIVPMIAESLRRIPMLGLEIIAWDYMCVPMPNAVLAGVAVAVRGYDLAGPGKELMQFRAFSTWRPEQDEVDKVVGAIIDGLRTARSGQVNGQ